MEVSFYLKRADNTEPTAIFARICYMGIKMKYYPTIKIHPKYWNKEKQQARQTLAGYASFNDRLKEISSDAANMLREYQNANNGEIPTPEQLKNMLDGKLKNNPTKTVKHTLLSYLENIIKDTNSGIRLNPKTGKPIAPNTIKTYETTKRILTEYVTTTGNNIEFENINLEFYEDFKEYLIIKLKLAANTIGKVIAILKLALNEATERGINTNLAYKSKRFITIREQVENVYLNENELLQLEKLDLSKEPKLDRVRDLFLIGCYTGLRFSDFSTLTPEQLKGDFIELTQTKTGEPIVIPIHDKVKEITAKYGGKLPPAISNQKMNEYIKDVAKKVDDLKKIVPIKLTEEGKKVTKHTQKYNLISTHTARRSFATNEFEAGTPTMIIMAITGHKTEAAFMKYIKTKPKGMAIIMKDRWDVKKNEKENAKLIPLTA